MNKSDSLLSPHNSWRPHWLSLDWWDDQSCLEIPKRLYRHLSIPASLLPSPAGSLHANVWQAQSVVWNELAAAELEEVCAERGKGSPPQRRHLESLHVAKCLRRLWIGPPQQQQQQQQWWWWWQQTKRRTSPYRVQALKKKAEMHSTSCVEVIGIHGG